jgi:large subunit ribosomal protein L18
MKQTHYLSNQKRRTLRVRHRLHGSPERPRLHVFRSNRHLYAQIINDEQGKTVIAVSDFELKKKAAAQTKSQIAQTLGELIAAKAKTKKITLVCFDRGHYQYHGRIRIFADAARSGGLQF